MATKADLKDSTDFKYESLLESIYFDGKVREDRTGTGTKGIFGSQLRFDLNGRVDQETGGILIDYPLLTTKKMGNRSILGELLWFLSGSTNEHHLQEKYGVTIWEEWADDNGELGKIYGYQWRNWDGEVDQVAELLNGLMQDPFSRRHIITAWNPSNLNEQKLPPCHVFMQFHVSPDAQKLSMQVYQRSADMFLGVPYNIASYSMLLTIIARLVGMLPDELIWTGGDTHIYSNHLAQVQKQLENCRDISNTIYKQKQEIHSPDGKLTAPLAGIIQPKLLVNFPLRDIEYNPSETPDSYFNRAVAGRIADMEDAKFSDFVLSDYFPYPRIIAPVAV